MSLDYVKFSPGFDKFMPNPEDTRESRRVRLYRTPQSILCLCANQGKDGE